MLRLVALLVPLALAACAVGPNHRVPESTPPPAWSEGDGADATADLASWWSRFGDATLTSLVERALAANLELRAADARVREAAALRRVAGAPLFPWLSAGGEAEREFGRAAMLDSALGALEATWEIDVFGGTRRALEAAGADYEASIADRRALIVLLVGELARSYVELRGFEALLDTVSRNLATQRETRDLTEAQLRAGLASDLDVERARALMAATAAELPPLDAARRASAHRLAVLLGEPPTALAAELDANAPIPSIEDALVVGVPADLLRRRPDLARAERELAAATARIGVAVADLYPRFTLTGSVGLRSESVKELMRADAGFAAVGPNVAWPIFAAGRLRANVRAADARQEQALAGYELALLEAYEDVENALVRHTREQLRRRSLREAVDANRESADLARRLYANGLGAFLDVLVAERSLLESESRLVESETAVSTSLVALYVALGGGWEQAEEPARPVTRPRAIAAAVAVLVALGLAIAALRSNDASTQTTVPEEAPLAAEAYVVQTQPVRETLRTVGTLLANESVNLVSELSRRLVSIDVAEGTEVKKGARLFQLDDADLRAQLAELEVRRQLAARTLERQRALLQYEKKALSQQAYDQAATDLQAVDAQIAALRVTLAKTEIRAPFDASVGLRRVSEGAWITPDTLLTTLQDTSRIKIDFTLPERFAGAIAIDQPFSFQVAGRGDTFEGRVIAVEPAIEATTRSVRVRGVADNPSRALVPGAFASVDVPLERAGDGILVPAQAIVPSATGHAVWVVRDGRAELREVEIGLRTRDSVEVVRGLASGETVLTTNLLRLRAGARVAAVAPGPG